MTVTVEVSFSFKHELDTPRLALDLPEGVTVLEALWVLAQRYPHIKQRLFTKAGVVHRYINALINGENVSFKRGFQTILHDKDRLTLLPPVGGG